MTSTDSLSADETPLIWPDHRPTSLVELPRIAEQCGVANVIAKLENERPLGNFKSLGGMYATLWALAQAAGRGDIAALLADVPGGLPTPICASDGNHGLAVAAAAHRVGIAAQIYLHAQVPSIRAARIAALGAEIIWVEGCYDDAVGAAVAAARAAPDLLLVADTTDRAGDGIVAKVMTGYARIAAEIGDEIADGRAARPTHLFVQVGVGGLAAAMADGLAAHMRAPGQIICVEPETAPCVARALSCGAPERVAGTLQTSAEMLSCGLASVPAIATLLSHRARSLLVDEVMLEQAPSLLAAAGGPATTPSGAAGLAGLLRASRDPGLRSRFGLDARANMLLIVTEGA